MTTQILFGDEVIDLAKPTQHQFAAMWQLYETHLRRKGRMPLYCLDAHGGQLYLKKMNGRLIASHYPGEGGCTISMSREPEGPDHLHMKEYAGRALSDAGYTTAAEFTTEGRKTRLDVAVLDAPIRFGIEAQFSPIEPRLAKYRTTMSLKAGIPPIWMPGTKNVADGMGFKVPILRHNEGAIDWTYQVPQRHTVFATSVRKMRAGHCTPSGPFDRCPLHGRGSCYGWHPWWNNTDDGWLSMDDALVAIAENKLAPLQDHKGIVRITPIETFGEYLQLTGETGELTATLTKSTPPEIPDDTVPCKSERKPEPAGLHVDRNSYAYLCQRCGHTLYHPVSIANSLCEACRLKMIRDMKKQKINV